VKLRSTLLACLVFAAAVNARAADAVNYSDLWWNPDESGWGVGLQRQGDVIFMTLFVYGTDGAGTWFVAPDVRLVTPTTAASSWRGKLYRASGPAFATLYDSSVQASEAGDASVDFDGANTGTLRYSVDGVAVTKRITRMTWREPSAAGRYNGGFTTNVEQCVDPTRVGAYDFTGAMTVTQAGHQVSVAVTSGSTGIPSSCTFTGSASYAGRETAWIGTFGCTIILGLDGRGEAVASTRRAGTFRLERIAIGSNGFHGALTAADQDCAFTGYLGGVRLP